MTRVRLVLLVAVVAGVVGSSGSATPIPCNLTLKLGARSASSGQFHANLVLANRFTTCRLHGFPNVELIGPVDPTFGSIYVLPRQAGDSRRVTLRPGQRAHAVLTWLKGGRWTPGYVRVVVPTSSGASVPMAVPWRFGPVLRQDAATHPGTYVGPIR